MENQSHTEEKSQTKETLKFFVKLMVSVDLGFTIIIYLTRMIFNDHFDIITTTMFIIGVQFVFGPLLLSIALLAYFVHLSKLSNIPINTTLYECINSPTIQYGPIKVIGLKIIEENVDNHIETSEN